MKSYIRCSDISSCRLSSTSGAGILEGLGIFISSSSSSSLSLCGPPPPFFMHGLFSSSVPPPGGFLSYRFMLSTRARSSSRRRRRRPPPCDHLHHHLPSPPPHPPPPLLFSPHFPPCYPGRVTGRLRTQSAACSPTPKSLLVGDLGRRRRWRQEAGDG